MIQKAHIPLGTILILLIFSSSSYAQILYVPSGTAGIGTSSNGNVGIGTSAPRGKFDVDGSGDIYLSDDPNSGTSQSLYLPGHIYLSPYDGGNVSYFQARRSNTSGSTSLQFRTTNAGTLVEAMIISNGGNIGIGTTTPRAVLDIGRFIPNATLGTVLGRLQEGDGTGSGTYLGVRGYETGMAGYNGKAFSLEHAFYGSVNSSINFYRGGSYTGGFLTFHTDDNRERMRITANGNVGIGTNNPDATLAVKGHIHTQEVRVDMNGSMVPDYVFEKNYNLRTLAEVENYINQNKHLPEVPAAKEMEANGINLGEMNMLLLKKVEELTLYILEQEKRIRKLENR